MAIKKKITYSVSYTAGTDTLSTKLNSILSDIVGLILSHNSGLSILDTITVGSERFTGAPLYDTYVSGLYSNDYNNRHYQSDVVFIGTNEDNVCLSLGFFDGQLVVAMNMTPKVEKSITDVWSSRYGFNASSYLPFYACGKASRWFKSVNSNQYEYSIPYRIVNNVISMSVLYWNTEYSKGYSFINGAGEADGTDLVIYPTDEGNNTSGLGAAIWRWGNIDTYRSWYRPTILAFSFSENLLNNPPVVITGASNSPTNISNDVKVLVNGRYDHRAWSSAGNNGSYHMYMTMFAGAHVLGGGNGDMSSYFQNTNGLDGVYKVGETYSCNTAQAGDAPTTQSNYYVTALTIAYNLPHLESGQAYVRKMRIPGWNPNCKGEIYLLWTPSLSAYNSGDIVEIGNKQYAIITEGVVCWAARVS